jgi:hypothetical protein
MPNQAKHHSKRKVDDYSDVMKHEHTTGNFFKAFIPKPQNIVLDIQDKDEQIILVLRQHLITQVRELFIILGVIVLIPALLSFSGFLGVLPLKFIGAFNIFWLVLAFGMIAKTFLIWFFNVYIITDERVIDVDFTSMISHDVSSAKIENIEDVTASTAGPLAAVFDYGTILIQTAGEKTVFEFGNVPQPSKVTKLLNELILEEERENLAGRAN